jgi:hypothetical protein
VSGVGSSALCCVVLCCVVLCVRLGVLGAGQGRGGECVYRRALKRRAVRCVVLFRRLSRCVSCPHPNIMWLTMNCGYLIRVFSTPSFFLISSLSFSLSFSSSLPFPLFLSLYPSSPFFSAFEYNDYVRSVDGTAFQDSQVTSALCLCLCLCVCVSPSLSLSFLISVSVSFSLSPSPPRSLR